MMLQVRTTNKFTGKCYAMVETSVQELHDTSKDAVRVDFIKLSPDGDVQKAVDLNSAGSDHDVLALSLLTFTGTIARADEEYSEA